MDSCMFGSGQTMIEGFAVTSLGATAPGGCRDGGDVP